MKQTSLNDLHRKLGARMVGFAGWDMPVQYAGVREEHMAVRTRCGIFDVSHMGEIEIRGPQAEAVVQKLTCNDASRLQPGQSQYSAFLTETGTFVDDIIVNRLAPDRFLICVNASNADKDFAWVKPHATSGTTIANRSDNYFLIAIQGPDATALVGAQFIAPLPAKPFTLVETAVADVPLIISRTGYTGEDGFEIYGPWDQAAKIWTPLIEAGAVPCGLGARDTLRLEAALPLYGHEIDDMIHPFEAGLGWIVKMGKGDFIGRSALAKIAVGSVGEHPLSKKLVGLEMQEPGIARQGYKIFANKQEVGYVTSGTLSPTLNKAIAMGYVTIDAITRWGFGGESGFAPDFESKQPALPGRDGLMIDIHRKTRHAIVVPLPFYKRKK